MVFRTSPWFCHIHGTCTCVFDISRFKLISNTCIISNILINSFQGNSSINIWFFFSFHDLWSLILQGMIWRSKWLHSCQEHICSCRLLFWTWVSLHLQELEWWSQRCWQWISSWTDSWPVRREIQKFNTLRYKVF